MSCGHNQIGTHNCVSTQCVRLACAGGGPGYLPPQENSTLIHGSTGILSIEFRNENKSICDDEFSEYGA